jgi:hypothetical protein
LLQFRIGNVCDSNHKILSMMFTEHRSHFAIAVFGGKPLILETVA